MASWNILILDDVKDMADFDATIRELLDGDVDITRVDQEDSAAIAKAIVDADGILNPLVVINDDLLATMKRCRIIVKMGIGYDNIDADAAAKRGICVANIPDYCQGEVADHAMALFLALNRRIVEADRQVRSGVWNDTILHPDTPRLSECVFGLLGCGFIARATAERARAFGMETIGYDPFLTADYLANFSIRKIDDLDEFLGQADFISLHIPATAENRGLINMETLKKMKRSALLINTARGAVVNEADLYTALKEGVIAGAGLDVQVNEPPHQPSPFNELPNIVLTPHTAYYSTASDRALRIKGAEEIARTFLEGRPKAWVNQQGFVPRTW
ncbi:MAG: C-terminal binding protein [Planctomycetaceae bacterium]|nr:C-terminal binding protein [Planctomycetaceae bacterium]